MLGGRFPRFSFSNLGGSVQGKICQLYLVQMPLLRGQTSEADETQYCRCYTDSEKWREQKCNQPCDTDNSKHRGIASEAKREISF